MRGTINVDMDGVVYPFEAQLARFVRDFALVPEHQQLPKPTKFDFWDEWGMTEGEWKSVFRKGVTNGYIYTTGRPIEGAVNSLWRLSDDGWNVRIVTKRLNHFRVHRPTIEATTDWLEDWNIPYRSIAFLGDEPKADYIAEIAIDDNAFNFGEGSTNLLFDQPWNRNDYMKLCDRVDGWVGVMGKIKEYYDE